MYVGCHRVRIVLDDSRTAIACICLVAMWRPVHRADARVHLPTLDDKLHINFGDWTRSAGPLQDTMAQVEHLSVLVQGCMGFSGGSPQASGSIARVARCKGGAPSPGRLPEDDVRPAVPVAVPVADHDCAVARTRLRVPGSCPARVSELPYDA